MKSIWIVFLTGQLQMNGKRGEIDRTTYEQILAQGGNAWQENRTVVSKKVEYTLALLLNAQITGGSGYQYKFVTNKTTFDIVIKLLEYLQKGVDAVKNALSTIFHWTEFILIRQRNRGKACLMAPVRSVRPVVDLHLWQL